MRTLLILLLGLWPATWLFGQSTLSDTDASRHFRDGVELFEKEKYVAAQRKFGEYIRTGAQDDRAIQSEYYVALCAMYLNNPDFELAVHEFVRRHPAHPKAQDAYLHVGSYYFGQQQWAKAASFLEQGRADEVTQLKDMESGYQLGYAWLMLKKNREAARVFNLTKRGSHPYAAISSYYSGYLAYKAGDYQTAMEDLGKAASDPALAGEAQVLLTTVHYKQKQYDVVLATVQKLEKQPGGLPKPLYELAGESYFRKNDMVNAVKYLQQHVQENKATASRGVHYRLGYAHLQNKDYKSAIPHLSLAADGTDTTAMLGAYHLGVACVISGDKERGENAFDLARKMNWDAQVQEASAFSYTKVSYETGKFSEAIAGADFYLARFPNSPNRDSVSVLMSESYLNTGDYDKALARLRRNGLNTDRGKATYQRITFNKAVQFFNDNKYREAIEQLSESLKYPQLAAVAQQAWLWTGESYSALEQYEQAIPAYDRVQADQTKTFTDALYGKAYALFSQKKYDQAGMVFAQFLDPSLTSLSTKDQRTDAMLRLADCVYTAKQYGLAEQYYRGADREGAKDKEYILFQMGMIYMMTGNLAMADKGFGRIYELYPNSRYNEPALYYRGEMWGKSSSPEQGVSFLTQLIGLYPKGKYAALALQQRALIYRNQRPSPRNDLAAQDFQTILDQYLLSEPDIAANAIKELQDISTVLPDVEAKLKVYVARYMQAYPNSDVASASGYEEAEKLFADAKYLEAAAAFEQFIRNFPQSAKTEDAYFLLGQSYEKSGKLAEALVAFGKTQNNRRPNALRNMAEIQFRRGEYGESISLWARLKSLNPPRRNMLQACQGMMRAYFANKDYKGAIEQAEVILRDFPTESSAMGEALLYKGKVALAENKYADALTAFNSVLQSLPASASAAEAQYNIGLTYRQQKDYARSNEELKKVQRNFETYRNWVYESVLLLAENFIDTGDRTQARASLQSIIDNGEVEEYRERARQRLGSMES